MKGLGVILCEVQLDSISRGITEEELALGRERDLISRELNFVLSKASFHLSSSRARKRDVIERIDNIRRAYFVWRRLRKMKERLISNVEPIPEALEWRTIAQPQADHVDVEVTQSIEDNAACSEVVVAKACHWHGHTPNGSTVACRVLPQPYTQRAWRANTWQRPASQSLVVDHLRRPTAAYVRLGCSEGLGFSFALAV